jgi:hypothetical protein
MLGHGNKITTGDTSIRKRLLAPFNGLKVKWFDGWHPVFDEALKYLPEIETCPHELFRLLITNPDSAPKKTVLVTKQGTPVAIVPLRMLGRHTYEVPTWMIPGVVFPAKRGFLVPALEALGIEVWVTWRQMEGLPTSSSLIRNLIITPLHVIQYSNNYESYWRDTGNYKNIKQCRNRCKEFEVTINSPGSVEWTIRNAANKWRNNPEATTYIIEDWAVSDWIVAAKYLERREKHYTLLLLDHGTPIGGSTIIAHGKNAIGGLIYRDSEYNWYGIGARLLDLCISFAAEAGFETFDLGGMADYKRRWAPLVRELLRFNLCPEPLFRVKKFINLARAANRKIADLVKNY